MQMKLVAAQIASYAGNLEANIRKHVAVVERAANLGADGIVFPELSLSGYEPTLAEALAILPSDDRLEVFQQLSERLGILIAVGAPTRADAGVAISMITFQPGLARCTYSKQQLHADELPFFTPGTQQQLFACADHVVAPAICYESLQANHAQQAADAGAQIYFTSVAKSERGVAAAYSHYPAIAKQHGMTVLMANCVGPADNYVAAGQSGVWGTNGDLLVCADASAEALVLYDLSSGIGEVVGLSGWRNDTLKP
jgi:predicted amidohydrolase